MTFIRYFVLPVLSVAFFCSNISANDSVLEEAVLTGDWQSVFEIVTDTTLEHNDIHNFLKHISCITLDLDCTPFLFIDTPPEWVPLEKSKKWMKSLRKRHKRNATLSYLMSNIYYRSGDYKNVLKELNKAVHQNDKIATIFLARSKVHILLNHLEEGIEDANSAIRLDSNLSMAYTYRGHIFAIQEKYQFAISNYTYAIRLRPNRAANYYKRAHIFRYEGRNNQAIADYTQTLALDSIILAAYVFRADMYFAEAELDNALVDYRKFEFLGSVQLKSFLPMVRSQIEAIELILAKEPEGKVETLLIMSIHALEAKKYEDVITKSNKALSYDSTRSDAYYWRAFGNWYLNHWQQSIDDFTTAIHFHPGDTTAYFNRGALYADSSHFDIAIKDYSSAIKLDSNYVKAYESRAIAYEKVGIVDSAIIDYESMLKVISDIGKEPREDIEDLVEYLRSPDEKYDTKSIKTVAERAYKLWGKWKWSDLAKEIYYEDLKSFQKVMIPFAEKLFGSSEEYYWINGKPHRKGDFLDGPPDHTFVFQMEMIAEDKSPLKFLAKIKFGGVDKVIMRGSNHAIVRIREKGFGEHGRKVILVDNRVIRTKEGWKIRIPEMLLFLSRFVTLEPFPYGDRKGK